MTVGRNDRCPCGSGNKYKNCCIGKERTTPRGLIYLIVVIALIAATGLAATLVNRRKESLPRQSAMPAATAPRPQPPGPAPAGKVWSVEHGHWHDANQAAQQAAQGSTPQPTRENPIVVTRRNAPQPPGPVPEGKVWSPEHGHWHAKK